MGEEVGLKAYSRYVVSFCMLRGTFRELLHNAMDRSGVPP